MSKKLHRQRFIISILKDVQFGDSMLKLSIAVSQKQNFHVKIELSEIEIFKFFFLVNT